MTFQTGNGCAAGIASPIGGAARPFNLIGKEIGMEWKDQYKHPNWQKKRLEVLEDRGFACEMCGDEESQLHVHHKRYVKGRKMWEYDISELSVLCAECHETQHAEKDALGELIAKIQPDGFSDVVAIIAGYCSSISGPCAIDAEELIQYEESNQAMFVLGQIAAITQHRSSRNSKSYEGFVTNLQTIRDALLDAPQDGE